MKSTGTNPSKEGHDRSHIDDTKPVIRDWFDGTTEHKLTQRLTILQRLTQDYGLLLNIEGMTQDLAALTHENRSRQMNDT